MIIKGEEIIAALINPESTTWAFLYFWSHDKLCYWDSTMSFNTSRFRTLEGLSMDNPHYTSDMQKISKFLMTKELLK